MSSRIALRGSYRQHSLRSVKVGRPSSNEQLEITLVLRRKAARSAPLDSRSIPAARRTSRLAWRGSRGYRNSRILRLRTSLLHNPSRRRRKDHYARGKVRGTDVRVWRRSGFTSHREPHLSEPARASLCSQGARRARYRCARLRFQAGSTYLPDRSGTCGNIGRLHASSTRAALQLSAESDR